jgi:hypothetical protein
MSAGTEAFLRLLQGQQQAAPTARANMMRQYKTPMGNTPPMALRRRMPPSAMPTAPKLSPMMQAIANRVAMSKLTPGAGQVGLPTGADAGSQPSAPTMPQGGGAPAATTFGQRFAQPQTQALLGAAIAGAEASGYQDTPVSLGQVLGRMGAGAMGGYQAAEDRIVAQKAASQKSVIDRLLAEAQYAKATRPDTTSLLKNLAAAGIDPNSPEGQKIIMDALTKPGTTIMTGGEGEFLKEGIKAGFATIKEAQTDIKTDSTLAPRVMQIIDLIEGGAETGRIQSATMGLRQLGKELGFLSDEQVSNLRDQEVLRSAMSYMVPRMRVTGSGASSDRDMAFFAQAAPMMTNTPEGNLIIAKMFKQLMDYNKKRLTLMGKTLKKDKNLLGFEEAADAELGAFYQRAKTQDDLDALVGSGAIKEGDVFYNGLAGEFQILGRD